MQQTTAKPSGRRNDLDALRAAAMLLGIFYHAALSMAAGLPWFVQDASSSRFMYVFQSAVHGFRMPLFFIVSGFFTAMLWKSKGIQTLVSHRFRRVLLPCLVGLFTVVPLCNWMIGKAMEYSAARSRAAIEKRLDDANIWSAIRKFDSAAVKQFIDQGFSLTSLHPEYRITPIAWAALVGDAASARALLDAGCDPNARSEDQNTALHAAAFLGRRDIASLLIERGADVNAESRTGETPLAAARGDLGIVPFIAGLLNLQVDVADVQAGRRLVIAELERHGATMPTPTANADASRAPPPSPNWDLSRGLGVFQNFPLIASWWTISSIPPSPKTGGTDWVSIALFLVYYPMFSFLWFLWFLWWYVVLFAILVAVARWIPWRPRSWSWIPSPWVLVGCILVTMLPTSRFDGSGWLFGPDTALGVIPLPHVFAFYAIFFAYGIGYYLSDDQQGRLGRSWRWLLPIAFLVVFPVALEFTNGMFGFRESLLPKSWHRWASIIGQSLFAWTASLGCIGGFRAWLSGESRWVRYMSDASYWLYVTHLPLVVALQMLVLPYAWPAWIKLLLISAVTILVLLAIYHVAVRSTWIGVFLNGRRPARRDTIGYEKNAVPQRPTE